LLLLKKFKKPTPTQQSDFSTILCYHRSIIFTENLQKKAEMEKLENFLKTHPKIFIGQIGWHHGQVKTA
jgi:hypothetical protein